MKTGQRICQLLAECPATSAEIQAELECSFKAVTMSLLRLSKAKKIRVAGTVQSSGQRPFYLWELNHATVD